jgi:heme exporter protein A
VNDKPLIEAKSLFCERDDRVLFESLSFDIHAGEMVQIEGPNGSGKTTLLRILSGLSEAYEGEIYFNGEDIASARAEYFSNLLYLGHKPGVKAVLTPVENLVSYTACRVNRSGAEIEAALAKVGLNGYEDVPCHSLSAGQHRRVALARLYLSDAPLWILDEAFTAIDKAGVKTLEQLMAQRVAEGGTIILTTHHELSVGGGLRKITLGTGAIA